MMPKIYLPYVEGKLRAETLEAVRASGLPFEPRLLTTDTGYHDLVAQAWHAGETFQLVEQDIVPHRGALAELASCPESWCAFGYEYPPFGIYAGMGCAKFSADLLARFPDALTETGQWFDAKHAPGHWCRVDGWLKQYLMDRGQQQHKHGLVQHLHAGKPAHDCTTSEELAQIREAERSSRPLLYGLDQMPSLSFLVPTHREDRPLWRCLDSIAPQLHPSDEVLVIGDTHDGPLPRVQALVEGYGSLYAGSWRYLDHDAGKHTFGHDQLNYGMAHARGDWLSFNDDDDIWTPDAAFVMRAGALEARGRPMLFRHRSYHGGTIYWQQRGRLERNWIGGHSLVCPNIPEKLGQWGPEYSGDFDVIEQTLALHGGPASAIWHDEIIAIARPDQKAAEPPGARWP